MSRSHHPDATHHDLGILAAVFGGSLVGYFVDHYVTPVLVGVLGKVLSLVGK